MDITNNPEFKGIDMRKEYAFIQRELKVLER